jgi:hypothetical protein
VNTPRRPVVTLTLSGLAVLGGLVLAPPGAQALATGCSVTPGATDYNGDGYDDAAVGDPEATVAGVRGAGAVTVLLGGADGRIGGSAGRVLITRANWGETPEAGDHFGHDVALAPTGHDGRCAGLLVGAPGADVGRAADAGMAWLISDLPDVEGTPQLDASPLTQADVGGSAEAGDQFGSTVLITGTDQEGRPRLAVGAPGEDVGSAEDAGSVGVFEVDRQPEGLAELQQGRRGPLGAVVVPGTPQTGDRFGAALASGPLDLPERSGAEVGLTLVVGAPGDTVSGRDGAGSVTVLQEKYESAVLLSQSTAGVPGVAETADGFGTSVALNPRSATQVATLAVGSPGEDAGTTSGTGSVTLFGNTGERIVPGPSFSQASAGVPGANEAGDHFGASLAFGHHGRTLLVGVPDEDLGRVRDAGAVQPVVLAGRRPVTYPASITENAPGTAGSVGTGHHFGRTLGSLSGRAEHLLTISSPYALRGSVYVLSDRSRVPARSWVPAAGARRFGWAVSN